MRLCYAGDILYGLLTLQNFIYPFDEYNGKYRSILRSYFDKCIANTTKIRSIRVGGAGLGARRCGRPRIPVAVRGTGRAEFRE
jgi:hypothetical protein